MKCGVLLDFDTNIDLQLLVLKSISGTGVVCVLLGPYPTKLVDLRVKIACEDGWDEADQEMGALEPPPQSRKQ